MHNSAYLERPDPTLCRVKGYARLTLYLKSMTIGTGHHTLQLQCSAAIATPPGRPITVLKSCTCSARTAVPETNLSQYCSINLQPASFICRSNQHLSSVAATSICHLSQQPASVICHLSQQPASVICRSNQHLSSVAATSICHLSQQPASVICRAQQPSSVICRSN